VYIEQKKCSNFKGLTEVGDVGKGIAVQEWMGIGGVGEIVANSLYDWFQNLDNQHLLKRLEKNGLKLKERFFLGKISMTYFYKFTTKKFTDKIMI